MIINKKTNVLQLILFKAIGTTNLGREVFNGAEIVANIFFYF